MKIDDVFSFGKYKGYTLKEVMAEHGSYVGWCLENIPSFHIEPMDMEKHFLKNYNKWKKNHKGMTVHYSSRKRSLPLGVESMEMDLVNMLNERHLGGLI